MGLFNIILRNMPGSPKSVAKIQYAASLFGVKA